MAIAALIRRKANQTCIKTTNRTMPPQNRRIPSFGAKIAIIAICVSARGFQRKRKRMTLGARVISSTSGGSHERGTKNGRNIFRPFLRRRGKATCSIDIEIPTRCETLRMLAIDSKNRK
jgi:hypothetical protein